MRLLMTLLASGIAIAGRAQQTLHIKITGGETKTTIAARLLIFDPAFDEIWTYIPRAL